ncbi:MAG: M56 family metallopeptidase [Muribaculaceae bacterium]|nr:M56 family metallopeptidase [Muribaculaceae bacterium]
MGKFLAYLIISGLIMIAMYLAYKLFIARDNQHGFNRGVLLVVYVVSFISFPLYNFFNNLAIKTPIEQTNDNTGFINLTLEPFARPLWGTILIWIFLIGAFIVTIKTIITWIRIVRVVHSGEKVRKDSFTLVFIDDYNIAPFSWLHYIIINRNDFNNTDNAIITHELKHVRALHWIDLLIAQIVCILNWFNPVAWLMRDELMLVHEYQADMAVIDNGHDPQEYQMLLVKKAVGSRFPSLTNSINHSKLKKRITMMYKSKSGAGGKLKALALVPMVALALGVVTVPTVKAAVSAISDSDVSLDKGNENSAVTGKFRITSLNNSGIETTVVVMGEDLGNNLSVSGGTFTNNGQTYTAKSLNTTMTNGAATITAVFPVSESYENASIAFNINGQDVKLNLDDFRRNSQTNSISISPSNGIVISQGNSTLSTVGDMEIYLDGKKISEKEMKALNPETIVSMSIDKQKNAIYITSK